MGIKKINLFYGYDKNGNGKIQHGTYFYKLCILIHINKDKYYVSKTYL